MNQVTTLFPLGSKVQRGFTLIELLFASAILAIAALGFSASVPTSHSLSTETRSASTARRSLASLSAALEAESFAEVAVQHHLRGFAIADLAPIKDDADGLPGEIIFEPAPGNVPNCYKVTMRVRWHDSAGDHSIEEIRLLANVRADSGEPVSLDALAEFYGSGNGYFPNREYYYR